MSRKADFFKSYQIITKKPIDICVDEVCIDNQYINYTGRTEKFERGEFEVCEIKENTPLWAQVMPNRQIYIMQLENDVTVISSDGLPGVDFEWADPDNNPQELLDNPDPGTPYKPPSP